MPPKKNTTTNEDLFYLLQKLYENFEEFKKKNEKEHEKFLTMLTTAIGDIASIQENMTVAGYHNQQHFDKDIHQDRRLDRIENHIKLPAFAL